MRDGAAYYNEHEPFAAAWLRSLIAQGEIAPGYVDERDIRDVCPTELAGYTQCHFFAGIGGWSLAARIVGIPDDYPLWSGSCPCQPFSAAGGREGFADERHLWPSFFHLVEQCEPELVVGEQVSGGNVDPWFDLVQADLEGVGYAFGLCPAPSAGFGAPHIRDRAFWVADADQGGWPGVGRRREDGAYEHRDALWLADPLRRGAGHASGQGVGAEAALVGSDGNLPRERLRAGGEGSSGRLADANRSVGYQGGAFSGGGNPRGDAPAWTGFSGDGRPNRPEPTNGFWRDADWLGCTDGRWRPVEPGTFPLADGVPARVGRLRGYGNAINAQQAAHFLEAVISYRHERLAA